MMGITKRLELVYRPKTFREVLGQDLIVRELSALVRRGKIGRNMLFTGDRGSGKTSLVRLYAQALSCEANDIAGDPCLQCASCQARREDRGLFKFDGRCLFEYDTAAKGGNRDSISRVMESVRRSDINSRRRIVFFDEAHALERPAIDTLLKDIEEGPEGLLYIFATTEPSSLGAPLLSRLWTYTVRALSHEQAIGLLERVSNAEGIAADLGALKVLAAVKRNYPRDLLIGLGQIASSGEKITAETVKSAFGVNQVDVLIAYYSALARGDRETQASVFSSWNESNLLKAEWIRTFVVSLYYNNVLGLERVIDPLLHSSIASYGGIVEDLKKRLEISTEALLRAYFVSLLEFWALHRPRDDSSAALAIALFECAVERAFAAPSKDSNSFLDENSERELPGVGAPAGNAIEGNARDAETQYITPVDVRNIVNRSSFFSQHHGKFFNVRLEIVPRSENEDVKVADINSLCSQFSSAFGGGEHKNVRAPFGGVVMVDRSREQGIFGLMMAYVAPDARDLLASYFRNANSAKRPAVEIHFNSDQTKQLKFHWDGIFQLCAGMVDAEAIGSIHSRTDLLDLLGVRTRRPPRPIRGKRVSFFGGLADRAIEDAQAHRMSFLSALDDGAYEWVRKGWESKEAMDRLKQLSERKAKIVRIQEAYGSDPKMVEEELTALHSNWSSDCKRRPRSWTGWW